MGLVSKTNGDGSYVFENKGIVSKKIQNFDGVIDIWLVTFFSINCYLQFIVNRIKKTLRSRITYVDCAITFVDWVDQNN